MRGVSVLVVLLLTSFAWGQDAARDLTVRMFDTDRVGAVVVTPRNGAVRWTPCGGCREEAMTGVVRLAPKAGLLVWIRGDVGVETDGHRTATGAGVWGVDTDGDGLRVRVTLPSERYVEAVLMGEAAGDEPPASLRALAIVVRSFALTRKGELTDSTSTQVVRLGAVSAAVRAAVAETAGETLWFGGKQVPGYFTQSSGGVTEAANAAWGGVAMPWLRSVVDPASERVNSQWHAEIGLEEIRGALLAQEIRIGGRIALLKVVKRTGSGRVARMSVNGMEIPAGTFRFAMGRALGWNRLRSDLYTVRLVGQTAAFEGKGYGHGVGMSQAGARVMAQEGRDARSILGAYFPGAEIRVTAKDAGWERREGNGWTLLATGADVGLVRMGDEAWRKAVGLVKVTGMVHPVVTVFPSVALFRGVTGEGGWTLGATRGDKVWLQPRGRTGEFMLHEMLHVLVEHEAREDVPLWFREGLVEALAGPSGVAAGADIRAVEARLARPGSLAEAQAGHREAAGMVRLLGRVYSREVMVGWLKMGVPGEALGRVGMR